MAFGFGPFQVIARLAVGPTTQTFLALEDGGDELRTVRLETLHPQLSKDEKARRTFSNEAQIAARISHPTCVGVNEWGVHGGICWVSSDYVAGETWEYTLEFARRQLPVNEVVFVIAELCAGLQYAHTLRGDDGPYDVIHRGVSSKNVIVGDEGRPRLINFWTGKSRIVTNATETGVLKGSFRYMSPEQILGHDIDRRSDIYSLGEVLFESLSDREANRGGIEELAMAKLDGHPRLSDVSSAVHPDLDAICARALAVSPDERYPRAEDMRLALHEYLAKLRRHPTHESVREMLVRMFGNRIARRADVLQILSEGELDESEVFHALGGRAVTERDIFDGPDGGYDEAAFLATIRPGQMHDQEPLVRRRAKPAKASLALRAPTRAESSIPDPPPATDFLPLDPIDDDEWMDDVPPEELARAMALSNLPTATEDDDTGLVDREPTGIFEAPRKKGGT